MSKVETQSIHRGSSQSVCGRGRKGNLSNNGSIDQQKRGSEWMANYHSIVTILKTNTPSQGGVSVDVQRITELLEEHDDAQHLAVSFSGEYDHLESLRHNITQWTTTVHQIVLSDSLTLEERCEQLTSASHIRPKGATAPTGKVIHLWIRAFT